MSKRAAGILAGMLISIGSAPALTAQTYTASFEQPFGTSSWTENGHNFVLSDGDIRDYTAHSGSASWMVRPLDDLSIDQVIDAQSVYIMYDGSMSGEFLDITFTGYAGTTQIATKTVNFDPFAFSYQQVTFGSGWEAINRIQIEFTDNMSIVFADDFSYTLSAFPVELTAFSAIADGSTALLAWQTASETNNAGFEVEHRAGESWQRLSFVEGMGTTNNPQSYAYRTADLDPGRHVFRLRQVDFDGTFDYSPEVEMTITMAGAYVLSDIFPNPFNPQASFTLAVGSEQHVRVVVYDMLGRQVSLLHDSLLKAHETQRFTFDSGGLPSGTYLLHAEGETFRETRKLVLAK
jgi:hypothetical protein